MGNLTNPTYWLGPPLLLVVSLPLTFFAVATTTLAITLLTIRVSVVYFELGVALVHAYLFPEPPKPLSNQPSPAASSPLRICHRQGSSSSQDTPVPGARLYTKSDSSASLLGLTDMTRDFEGVGGWRFYEDKDEEALWLGMNKRLELGVSMPRRQHPRGLAGDRWSWSPEQTRMTPAASRSQSRARTPASVTVQDREGDDYFLIPTTGLRPLSMASEPLSKSALHSRRTSLETGDW